MIRHNYTSGLLFFVLGLFNTSCYAQAPADSLLTHYPSNCLDFKITPISSKDRSGFAFSDMGAWFAYGLPAKNANYSGFSGPFLLTQENGVWISEVLSEIELVNNSTGETIAWADFKVTQTSYNSHLYQVFENQNLKVSQSLVYASPHSAFTLTEIENRSKESIHLSPTWKGSVFLGGTELHQKDKGIYISSNKSNATGIIQIFGDKINNIEVSDTAYTLKLDNFELKKGETKQLLLSHSFIFAEYSMKQEQLDLLAANRNVEELLQKRIKVKQAQLEKLYDKLDTIWKGPLYKELIAKTVLTLQNNWRIPTGQLLHSGVFPSYHYIWFHGFWAWDSWKHAVAITQYDTLLASEQIKAMYDHQTENGFIPDCIYRDTTIEKHNYRNTKPPLSAWAVWKVYEQNQNIPFLRELYPKILKQHNWWYTNRDHDKDGICEYGSTDGSLKAAKWESGMDNAVRFDKSSILKNTNNAYSLDQESVDLNAYLYAEKHYLIKMALILGEKEAAKSMEVASRELKSKIQQQFFDPVTGWFYDTSMDGKEFINVMGCEGWIPLWAQVATEEQANAVKNNMVNSELFNTTVPLQTLSANHPDFEPNRGYWRGPNWLDQSYFGIKGLHNYGYNQEAYAATHKIVHNAKGVLVKGESIRENYHPLTGEGLEAENFSWSAAHYLLLLLNGL